MTALGRLTVWPVSGIGEVLAGQDLAELLAGAFQAGSAEEQPRPASGDVVVVTQKIVSKAEGRVVALGEDPEAKRRLIEAESRRVLRRRDDLAITETWHGFVCANAGVDLSNLPEGRAALLPRDPDRSARRLRDGLRRRTGLELAVIVSDTFGRPWRRGLTDVAVGCSGIAAVVDLRGTADAGGRPLEATEVCVADELASAAELVMGKDRGIPAAVVRGADPRWLRPVPDGDRTGVGRHGIVAEVVRPTAEDLFR